MKSGRKFGFISSRTKGLKLDDCTFVDAIVSIINEDKILHLLHSVVLLRKIRFGICNK